MLQALTLPDASLITAAALRLGGKAEVAGRALCAGLRVYARDGGFQVDSFTTDARYFVKDGRCNCPAFRHGAGGCKHSCIPAILELAQTLSQMDLVSYTCRGKGCGVPTTQPGLCPACLHPTMPKMKRATQTAAQSAADLFG